MCTLRAVWIFFENEIILSRRYPTVENRLSNLFGKSYSAIPLLDDVIRHLFREEVVNKEISEGCNNVISLKNNTIWPFIYIKRQEMYFTCVPVVEQGFTQDIDTISMIEMPSITAAFSFLEDLVDFTLPFAPHFKPQHIAELHSYISKMAPFGKPCDTDLNNVTHMVRNGFPAVEGLTSKRPAWKPYLYRGKQKLEFLIQERVQCVQYDKPTIHDTWTIQGMVLCKADLEGTPDVTATLQHKPKQGQGQVTNLTVDSCVQSMDGNGNASMKTLSHKLCFQPPLDNFTLCQYGVKYLGELPLRAFYQMKEITPTELKFLIQIKLSSKVNNNFEYCDLEGHFPNRGSIINMEAAPTCGTVQVTSDGKGFLWSIGQKFTGRNLEVAFPGTIHFQGKSPDAPVDPLDDPFLVGANSFVELRFKILGDTLSGMDIDKSVNIYPATKLGPPLIEKEIVTDSYIIWNSLGQVKHSSF